MTEETNQDSQEQPVPEEVQEEDVNKPISVEEAHEDDVYDLIHNTFYDIDDVELDNLNVKERW